jgi:hypothetical protein
LCVATSEFLSDALEENVGIKNYVLATVRNKHNQCYLYSRKWHNRYRVRLAKQLVLEDLDAYEATVEEYEVQKLIRKRSEPSVKASEEDSSDSEVIQRKEDHEISRAETVQKEEVTEEASADSSTVESEVPDTRQNAESSTLPDQDGVGSGEDGEGDQTAQGSTDSYSTNSSRSEEPSVSDRDGNDQSDREGEATE